MRAPERTRAPILRSATKSPRGAEFLLAPVGAKRPDGHRDALNPIGTLAQRLVAAGQATALSDTVRVFGNVLSDESDHFTSVVSVPSGPIPKGQCSGNQLYRILELSGKMLISLILCDG